MRHYEEYDGSCRSGGKVKLVELLRSGPATIGELATKIGRGVAYTNSLLLELLSEKYIKIERGKSVSSSIAKMRNQYG